MSVAVDSLHQGVRRIILIQAAIAVGVSMVCYVVAGWHELMSALYGGAIVVLASLWLGRHVRRAGAAHVAGSWGDRLVTHSMAVLRFAIILLLLAIGLGALQLAAPPLIVTFIATHMGFIAALVRF